MARQYAKTAGVRQAILSACFEAFSTSGFHGASMAEIARRADISHTGLLHHFPRKEDLLAAVLALQDERSEQFLREHGTLSDSADPLEALRGMLHTLVWRERHVGLVELSAVLTGEATVQSHPAHNYLAERYVDIRSFLARIFSRLREEGRLSTDLDAVQLAITTLALVEGTHKQWLYDQRGAVRVDEVLVGVLTAFVPELKNDDGFTASSVRER